MQMQATLLAVGDFVRRIVDSLLRGACRGKFLCSRCLVKLTKDHLDKRYTTREIAQVMDDIFSAPGAIRHVARSTCAACATQTMPCLGVPIS
jgi:ferredoxin